MTYHTLSCPHCKKIVNRATGEPGYIGNPFRKCPWCGNIYVDSFTQEWITKSPFKRLKFLIDKPLSGAILSTIIITGLLSMLNVTIMVSLIVGDVVAVLVFIVWLFNRKVYVRIMSDKSIERTRSAQYVKLLKQAGFKIYPIKGAEIGIVHDEFVSPLQNEDLKKTLMSSTHYTNDV